jgi:hypothetical protein
MNKPRIKERGQGVKPSKTAYIHMRVLPGDKEKLAKLAKYYNVSLSEYLVNCGLMQGDDK